MSGFTVIDGVIQRILGQLPWEALMENVVVVHFPGVVSDSGDSRAVISALGGQEVIRRFVEAGYDGGDRTLCLTLRPGNLFSRSNIGSSHASEASESFVLRVSKSSGTAEDIANGRLNAAIVARVHSQTSFPGIADFQYLDSKSLADVDLWKSVEGCNSMAISRQVLVESPADIVSQRAGSSHSSGIESHDWQERSFRESVIDTSYEVAAMLREGNSVDDSAVLLHMRPARFARTSVETGSLNMCSKMQTTANLSAPALENEKFRNDSCEQRPDGSTGTMFEGERSRRHSEGLFPVDRRFRSDKTRHLSHRVSLLADQVPCHPGIQLCLTRSLSAVVAYLQSKFRARPLWSRRALLANSSESVRRAFKSAVTRVAYAFCDMKGPFQTLWIRYGYDPRCDYSNIVYQTVFVRIVDPLSVEAIRRRVIELDECFGSHYNDLDQIGNHTICELPTKLQLTPQLCDTDISSLRDILVSTEYTQPTFDRFTGFLSKDGVAEIARCCRERVRKHAIDYIGESAALDLMQKLSPHKERMSSSLKRSFPDNIAGHRSRRAAGSFASVYKPQVDTCAENVVESGRSDESKQSRPNAVASHFVPRESTEISSLPRESSCPAQTADDTGEFEELTKEAEGEGCGADTSGPSLMQDICDEIESDGSFDAFEVFSDESSGVSDDLNTSQLDNRTEMEE